MAIAPLKLVRSIVAVTAALAVAALLALSAAAVRNHADMHTEFYTIEAQINMTITIFCGNGEPTVFFVAPDGTEIRGEELSILRDSICIRYYLPNAMPGTWILYYGRADDPEFAVTWAPYVDGEAPEFSSAVKIGGGEVPAGDGSSSTDNADASSSGSTPVQRSAAPSVKSAVEHFAFVRILSDDSSDSMYEEMIWRIVLIIAGVLAACLLLLVLIAIFSSRYCKNKEVSQGYATAALLRSIIAAVLVLSTAFTGVALWGYLTFADAADSVQTFEAIGQPLTSSSEITRFFELFGELLYYGVIASASLFVLFVAVMIITIMRKKRALLSVNSESLPLRFTCRHCGTVHAEPVRFCGNCGKAVAVK